MIVFKRCINNINEYQCGVIPKGAEKLNAPSSTEDMMKKATPVAVVVCFIMAALMFIKTITNHTVVVSPLAILGGFLTGFAQLIVHEWLHAIVYPQQAMVTIGRLKGKMVFVALASYPLRRIRFIIMCLMPFILGIIPLLMFIFSPGYRTILNGFIFGMSCMGMVSPFPDVYNVILVLKQTERTDGIMFYEDDIYRIPNYT